MTKNEWKTWFSVVGRILLASALVFAQGAWAAQSQESKDKTAAGEKAVAQRSSETASSTASSTKAGRGQADAEESEKGVGEDKPSGDGKHEGIKVHGHWTIEVRDPNGTLVTHREFENSLVSIAGCLFPPTATSPPTPFTPCAATFLLSVLARQASVSFWSVQLLDPSSTLTTAVFLPGGCCTIAEPGLSGITQDLNYAPFNGWTFDLMVVPNWANGTLVLGGSGTVTGAGNIGAVGTNIIICPANTAPSSPCIAYSGSIGPGAVAGNIIGFFPFTFASLPSPPISVQTGQTVAVTVNISFS